MYQCLLLLASLALVRALPGGAPMEACTSFIPAGHTGPEQAGDTPYLVDLSGFPVNDGGYYYEPETMYRSK